MLWLLEVRASGTVVAFAGGRFTDEITEKACRRALAGP